MSSPATDRELALRYLLGRAFEQEAETASARLFDEETFAEVVAEVETDLLDQYARGELTGADKAAVEERLLGSEGQPEKLRLARALAARRPAAVAAKVKGNTSYWWMGAIAAVLLVGIGVWELRPQPAALAPPPAPVAVVKPVEPPVFVAVLSPGATRGGKVREIVLPAGELLRFDLELEGEGSTWAAVLTAKGRGLVWQQDGVAAHDEAGGRVASVTIPRSALAVGVYELALTGAGTASYYEFAIR